MDCAGPARLPPQGIRNVSANTPAAAPAKSKKMLIIIIGVVVAVLVIGGGAAAWFISSRSHADEEDGAAPVRKEAPKVAPTFLPMENMVVKLYLPSIRSGILMLVSQRTSTELLQREGKEKLAADILREVSRPLGYTVPTERARAAAADKEEDAEDRPSRRRTERNPVHRVLFSSFIIQ